MRQMEASKLARGLGAALELVLAGESIQILRYGRVVALLVPATKREPRTVQPDKLGAADSPRRATGAPPEPPQQTAAERQRRVDEVLRLARGRPND